LIGPPENEARPKDEREGSEAKRGDARGLPLEIDRTSDRDLWET